MAESKINRLIVTENKSTSASTSINKGTSEFVTIDITKNGYTPIGVLNISKSGFAENGCAINSYYINTDDNTLTIGLGNFSTYNATVNVTATILYE